MKCFLLFALAFCGYCFTAKAQQTDTVWHDSTSTNSDIQAIQSLWKSRFQAFNTPDMEKAFSFCTPEFAAIRATGALSFDKNNIQTTWTFLVKWSSEKINFRYKNLKIRLITEDFAIAVAEFGIEVASHDPHTEGNGLITNTLHKRDGQWEIDFEQMTKVQ